MQYASLSPKVFGVADEDRDLYTVARMLIEYIVSLGFPLITGLPSITAEINHIDVAEFVPQGGAYPREGRCIC